MKARIFMLIGLFQSNQAHAQEQLDLIASQDSMDSSLQPNTNLNGGALKICKINDRGDGELSNTDSAAARYSDSDWSDGFESCTTGAFPSSWIARGKILPKSIFITLFLLIFHGCDSEESTSPEINLEPSPQKVEVSISPYVGTANCDIFTTHDLKLYISQNGYTLIASEISTNPNKLSGGTTFKFPYELDPGTYLISGFWDWDDNGGQTSYEPILWPNPETVIIDGFETAKVNVSIVDRTSPTDLGWVTGKITYTGAVSGWHHLYVIIQETGYVTISEKQVSIPGTLGTDLSSIYSYISGKVPAGNYFRVVAYWDADDSGDYTSGDPAGDWAGQVIISPGLPTVGMNIVLDH